MHEKTRCLAITGRTQSPTRPIAAAEIDLRGVLSRNDPPPLTARSRPRSERLDDLQCRHRRRRQKAMRRHLTRAVAANLAKHQRSGGNDPIEQPSAPLCPPDIPEFPNPLKIHHRGSPPEPTSSV